MCSKTPPVFPPPFGRSSQKRQKTLRFKGIGRKFRSQTRTSAFNIAPKKTRNQRWPHCPGENPNTSREPDSLLESPKRDQSLVLQHIYIYLSLSVYLYLYLYLSLLYFVLLPPNSPTQPNPPSLKLFPALSSKNKPRKTPQSPKRTKSSQTLTITALLRGPVSQKAR